MYKHKVIKALVRLGFYKIAYRISSAYTLVEIREQMKRLYDTSKYICNQNNEEVLRW